MAQDKELANINKAFVIGSGVSGISAARLLIRHGIFTYLFDGNEKADADEIFDKLKLQDADKDNVKIITGSVTDEEMSQAEICVPSPGVFPSSDIFRQAQSCNLPIWGEIELAYRFEKGKVIAITGTNGKTTTTTLVGEIMSEAKDTFPGGCFVVGNIGNPYTEEADKTTKDSISVAEISSYQLETVSTFHPNVSAILNITPDHMDRHGNMDEYERVKELICENQNKDDICVLNFGDERLKAFGKKCPARVIWFSSEERPPIGYYLKGDDIYRTDEENESEDIHILNIYDTSLLGIHNYENIMAALAMSEGAGVPRELALKVIKKFKAVEHRIEWVRDVAGVKYYNDSKGTNTDASIKAIQAMRTPVILIGGGYDKGGEFDDLIESFGDKVKELVLIGATADRIEKTALDHGFSNVKKAKNLEEAVKVCFEDAKEGESVLLSPACASWDMFKNYEERGRLFKNLVNDLKNQA